ncbi:hypothetical protein ACOSQ2_015151 [Xanthoceras sorbifolium]
MINRPNREMSLQSKGIIRRCEEFFLKEGGRERRARERLDEDSVMAPDGVSGKQTGSDLSEEVVAPEKIRRTDTELFPASKVRNLELWRSDHRLILLQVASIVNNKGCVNRRYGCRFLFEESWADAEWCRQIVEEVWSAGQVTGQKVNFGKSVICFSDQVSQDVIKVFLWCASLNWIPTLVNLEAKRVPMEAYCPLCRKEAKTTLHALWGCSLLKPLRKSNSRWAVCAGKVGMSFLDIIVAAKARLKLEDFVLLCVVMWHAWFRLAKDYHGSTSKQL